jgi:ubiquinone/menaquinone biosynthesis C-methylase UbiE
MSGQGARAVGLDLFPMLRRAEAGEFSSDVFYVGGTGADLPFKNNIFDAVVFFASLHHLPEASMSKGLEECRRILKKGGLALIIEPVAREGSYFELIRLVEDERSIQEKAYVALCRAVDSKFIQKEEKIIYLERSYSDYSALLAVFEENERVKRKALSEAKKITEKRAAEEGKTLASFRFRSICRLNVLEKSQ